MLLPRFVALVLFALAAPLGAQEARVTGTVSDAVTGRPLRLAIVRAAPAGTSQLTDDRGRFQLRLAPGRWILEVRQIGYAPRSDTLDVTGTDLLHDVAMTPKPYELSAITVNGDDEAARIIRRAIQRKRDLLAAVRDYHFDAAVKFTVRDLGKPADSAASVLVLTESRVAAHWERPDRFQERIVARRQSANMEAGNNLISVGEFLNFNRDRIELAQYQLVSPIADDALEHYRYRIVDTLRQDGRVAIRLAIEPRRDASPLFTGMVDIADSTWQVLQMDVGVNRATRLDLVENLRYRQHLADQGDDRWMPDEVGFSADIVFRTPIPGVPRRMQLLHLARLDGYRFDTGAPMPDAGVRLVVEDSADQQDHPRWSTPGIARTDVEERAMTRLDSLERTRGRHPLRRAIGFVTGSLLSGPDRFHFNRADGLHLGVSHELRPAPGLRLDGAVGYSFGAERLQYRLAPTLRLTSDGALHAEGSIVDRTRARASFPTRTDQTMQALLGGDDLLDYYRERGFALGLRARPTLGLTTGLRYLDMKESSLAIADDFTIGREDRPVRANPAIRDGHDRSFLGWVRWDSRPILRIKGEDVVAGDINYTVIQATARTTAPSLIASDFDYRRYELELHHARRAGAWGVASLSVVGGTSSGDLPPQRQFGVDAGRDMLGLGGRGLRALIDTSFAGTRYAGVLVRHAMGRQPFAATRLPGIRAIPFTVTARAAAFRVEGGGAGFRPLDGTYTEAGFDIGNLTPFLAPFNFAVGFTWQLSDQRLGKRFRLDFRIGD